MNLQDLWQQKYQKKDKGEFPTWKTVSTMEGTGLFLMTDGTIAKNLSPVNLIGGDRVLVYQGNILQIDWKKKRVHVPVLFPFGIYIVCFVGETTIDYNKEYYRLTGDTLNKISYLAGLIDDGKYSVELYEGFTASENPWDYNYRVLGDGLGIPETLCGRDIKDITGRRYMTNTAFEYEIFYGLVVTTFKDIFTYCTPAYSLCDRPYAYDETPLMVRYTDKGIISVHPYWIESYGVLSAYATYGETFSDVVRSVSRIYYTPFDDKDSHLYIQLFSESYNDAHDCIVTMEKYSKGTKQRVLETMLQDDGYWIITEPLIHRIWDVDKAKVEGALPTEDNIFLDANILHRNAIGFTHLSRVIVIGTGADPVIAGFTASSRLVTPNTSVDFTDTSVGAPTSWEWYRNEVLFSTEQNPSLLFINQGTHRITLKAKKDGNFTLAMMSVIVSKVVAPELNPPIASFSTSSSYYPPGTNVTFEDTSIGNPTSWAWFKDDILFSTEQNPTLLFEVDGFFTIRLRAINANPNAQCYFLRGGWISGTDQHGDPSTIPNSVKLPFDVSEDGALSYVSIDKNDSFGQFKTNIYIKDEPITENVFINLPVKYATYRQITGLYYSEWRYADLRIRPLGYKVLHSHIDGNFEFIMYQKYEHVSDSWEFKDFKAWWSSDGVYYRIGVAQIVSKVSYWVYLKIKGDEKGVHTNLNYQYIQKDNQMLISDVIDTDPLHPNIIVANGAVFGGFWIDVDKKIEYITNPDQSLSLDKDNSNVQLTRIFTSITDNNLFLGFDVYPVSMKHNLERENQDGGIAPEYVADYGVPFPPQVDSSYPNVEDRKWLLFDISGEHIELESPKDDATPPKNVKRINGLCLIEMQ